MARWIFGFRSTGDRRLGSLEVLALRRRVTALRVRRALLGAFAVVAFFGALGFLAIAAGGPAYAWVGTIPCLFVGGGALSRASQAERLALLFRRALRIGTVERFERASDSPVREGWIAIPPETTDEGDVDEHPIGVYWQTEERFEETLARALGRAPAWFEAVAHDGVALWIEGRLVREIVEPQVFDAKEPG